MTLVVAIALIGAAATLGMRSLTRFRKGHRRGNSTQITSQTPECEQDIVEALQRDLGVPIEVTGAELAAIFAGGVVDKGYARDGTRHEVSFGVERESEQCQLVLYWLEEPGLLERTTGNYGSSGLSHCQCE